ncbi:MAG: hypothetical protein UU46_C0036G0001 [Candidatus Uhrbacteria bacterium GW2011_GWD1_41_16]|uniref:Uncharacterized protein n=1 Tax=Candidatus Uhrbacteria bacterium GW2011_GWC1_41_20 TaxID=1618983 RepID=A0A0G0YB72_9BACT|nr:MAG: hypothetical protein UT52_C0027G0001 [Candidatus Uhrbacteria bacterium GW2011_GWE1_39_46]KKR63110.1 MAG: hypothetical protein UU04_C0026G0001 [Candidatus Uhrbacteria bacterium GW2011_GWC2_40_450]KKR94245.1 MAG: hypothetical protein UU46_C0036G0001 [Candidatus Uhrbacteria bacterium GW2011_GWD1_41_16]KKR97552.1 MAG: hypothetical protein UU50_C0028G0001 [Candidatus Uhrbacteria bacterium GW2011_GWC1_41_20]KKS06627.1 MAG: hypothetical protein UU62_C0036G0001 [Candidatus Uhrbacteria bacterium
MTLSFGRDRNANTPMHGECKMQVLTTQNAKCGGFIVKSERPNTYYPNRCWGADGSRDHANSQNPTNQAVTITTAIKRPSPRKLNSSSFSSISPILLMRLIASPFTRLCRVCLRFSVIFRPKGSIFIKHFGQTPAHSTGITQWSERITPSRARPRKGSPRSLRFRLGYQ